MDLLAGRLEVHKPLPCDTIILPVMKLAGQNQCPIQNHPRHGYKQPPSRDRQQQHYNSLDDMASVKLMRTQKPQQGA